MPWFNTFLYGCKSFALAILAVAFYRLSIMLLSAQLPVALLRKVLPNGVRVWLAKRREEIIDFFQFEVYAYRFKEPQLKSQLSQRDQPLKYLFLISPMRAGSSLLTHVLNSHPEISGYGESHLSYDSDEDLFRLVARTSVLESDFQGDESYVMDKMVWNYEISDELLQSENVYFLFLLRDPKANFRSIQKLKDLRPWDSGLEQWSSPEKCFGYLRHRLNFMVGQASRVNDPERCMVVEYDALLNQTDYTLEKIRKFLGLDSPILKEYSVSKTSGQFRYGDPSVNLKSGCIMPRTSVPDNEPVSPTVAKARQFYAEQLEKLKTYCDVVVTHEVHYEKG
jgi:hypothetical protein